jgi:hypothetical protein
MVRAFCDVDWPGWAFGQLIKPLNPASTDLSITSSYLSITVPVAEFKEVRACTAGYCRLLVLVLCTATAACTAAAAACTAAAGGACTASFAVWGLA